MLRDHLSRRIAALVGTTALLLSGTYFVTVPAVQANSYPGWANSHYVYADLATSTYMYNRGCDLGNGLYRGGGATNMVVVLGFGRAYKSGTTYGVHDWLSTGGGVFESTTWVADKVEQFGRGFYICSPLGLNLTIVAAVNSDDTSSPSTYLTASHGTAWSNMMDTIDSWFTTNNYSSQVWTHGGIDIESGFAASANQARAWVDAYSAAVGQSVIYDTGAATGCPTDASYAAPPGKRCSGSSGCSTATPGCFYQDDHWYLSWGCQYCYGIPQIYNSTLKQLPDGSSTDPNAQQWEGMRRYGYVYKTAATPYSGSATQYTSCHVQGRPCSGIDNDQLTGWTHLHNSEVYYTPSYPTLTWETDYMWGW